MYSRNNEKYDSKQIWCNRCIDPDEIASAPEYKCISGYVVREGDYINKPSLFENIQGFLRHNKSNIIFIGSIFWCRYLNGFKAD